ncbi:unnamed protein product [Chrysodeixis includens]|uniref:Uncharacterized protein n=1 Tax=Chrysodeixis includens TaxID=689277 RepID=A0A9N8KRI1_CHRIL|nr:unnamed protein product [Chrysodeixis includens]
MRLVVATRRAVPAVILPLAPDTFAATLSFLLSLRSKVLLLAGDVVHLHRSRGHGRRAVHRRLEPCRGRHGRDLPATLRPYFHIRPVRFRTIRAHFPSLLLPKVRSCW